MKSFLIINSIHPNSLYSMEHPKIIKAKTFKQAMKIIAISYPDYYIDHELTQIELEGQETIGDEKFRNVL